MKPSSPGRVRLDQPSPGGRLGCAACGRFRECGEALFLAATCHMDVGQSGPWTKGGIQCQDASPSATAGVSDFAGEEQWLDLRSGCH